MVGKERVRREGFGKAVTDNPHGNGNLKIVEQPVEGLSLRQASRGSNSFTDVSVGGCTPYKPHKH